MQTNLKEKVESNPILSKIASKVTLRFLVQAFVAIVLLYAAWNFYWFVDFLHTGNGSSPTRPPVAEGFLPIAAIVAFKAMFATGEIDPIHPAGLIIFIAIIVTGWIFRRSLCSWICPIGTLSEYLGKLGKKLFDRNFKMPKWLDIPLIILKYVLFAYVLKFIFMLPTEEAVSFMKIPYYAISDIKMFEMFMNLGLPIIGVIVLLMVLSILFKSFWCRYLCPYGAFVGLLGLFSPIILVKNNDTCIKCNRCNQACPNKVDVQSAKKVVLSSECTGCTSCVSVCPKENTLKFKLFGLLEIKPLYFGIAFIVVFFGIIIWAKANGHWETSLSIRDYQGLYQAMSGFSAGGF